MKICVVGLGYVGLPLAVELSYHFPVFGFDISQKRVNDLTHGIDGNGDYTQSEIQAAFENKLKITNCFKDCSKANFYIVTVPTPIDSAKAPDMSHLVSASEAIGQHLKPGDIVVYESTVYPGATEEVCIPILEKTSQLTAGEDFYIGYSPERINPGDKVNRLTSIVKVIAAQDEHTLSILRLVYGKVITAGLHEVTSIAEAEMSKVVENTQRDVNIAFVNEIAKVCNKLNINAKNVLNAASTKWNFLNFYPGLVGGHCIGVDPYYLISKAMNVNASTPLLTTAREVNESMVDFIYENIINFVSNKFEKLTELDVAIWGITFKPNVPDVRNSKAIEIVNKLIDSDSFRSIEVIDPICNIDGTEKFKVSSVPRSLYFDINIIITSHDTFKNNHLFNDILINKKSVLIDITSQYSVNENFSLYNASKNH